MSPELSAAKRQVVVREERPWLHDSDASRWPNSGFHAFRCLAGFSVEICGNLHTSIQGFTYPSNSSPLLFMILPMARFDLVQATPMLHKPWARPIRNLIPGQNWDGDIAEDALALACS